MPDATPFDPATDATRFRAALGSFVTGVTVVTTDTPEGPVGIVANSFASVSLDPPLVLWCPAKSSKRFEHFAGARRYAIHVLSTDQQDICQKVIEAKTAISQISTTSSHCGIPLIEGAVASFECTLEANHDAGDHLIVVGRVTKTHHRGGTPLVFLNGSYGSFDADA